MVEAPAGQYFAAADRLTSPSANAAAMIELTEKLVSPQPEEQERMFHSDLEQRRSDSSEEETFDRRTLPGAPSCGEDAHPGSIGPKHAPVPAYQNVPVRKAT